MKKTVALFIMLFVLVSALFVSCDASGDAFVEPDHNILVDASVGLSEGKSISVTRVSDSVIASYSIRIKPLWTSREGDNEISYGNFTKAEDTINSYSVARTTEKSSINIGYISQGTWLVEITAVNENDKEIYSGSSTICFTNRTNSGDVILSENQVANSCNLSITGITVPVLSTTATDYTVVVKVDGAPITVSVDGSKYTTITDYVLTTDQSALGGKTYYAKIQTGLEEATVAQNAPLDNRGLYVYNSSNQLVPATGNAASGTKYYRVNTAFDAVTPAVGDNVQGYYEATTEEVTMTFVSASSTSISSGSHYYNITYMRGSSVVGGESGVFFCVPGDNVEISGWISPSAFAASSVTVNTSGSSAEEVNANGTITCSTSGLSFDANKTMTTTLAKAEAGIALSASAATSGCTVTWYVDGDEISTNSTIQVGPSGSTTTSNRYTAAASGTGNPNLSLKITVRGEHTVSCVVSNANKELIDGPEYTIIVQ